MKKPVVDYRKFSFKKLNTPEFSHLKFLGGWIIYFALYFLTENLIPIEKCHLVHNALDDKIPFLEGFLIFYVLWFALIVFSLLYYMLYDTTGFKQLSTYIMITQLVAMLVYIIGPSYQNIRPAVMPRENFFTWILFNVIYKVDTPTGVCPSLHVAYSLGILSVWLKNKNVGKLFKCCMTVLVILICLSVAFIKQHSTWDILFAIPLGILAEVIVFKSPLAKKLK